MTRHARIVFRSEAVHASDPHAPIFSVQGERWHLPPKINTLHGPLPAKACSWREGQQADPGGATTYVLQGMLGTELVHQSIHSILPQLTLAAGPEQGQLTL